jgi:flagellar biosynthetic protein FlhB
MIYNFNLEREAAFDTSLMVAYLANTVKAAALSLIPIMVFLFVAALIGPVLLGGWLFSGKALMPKFERMNPAKGIGRMFSMNALVELAKALSKFVLVTSITVVVLKVYQQDLLTLSRSPVDEAILHAIDLVSWSVLFISAATIVIAIADVPYQIYDNKKKLKMTLQEVKDEMKDSEGKPEVKGRVRQMQRQLSQRRMLQAVPEADVVITNPEHFSVALKYDVNSPGAPLVVAKGGDYLALKIREIARAHDVELLAAPSLARAIYFTTEIDQEIPGPLYVAVAQVLAYVFQLKAHGQGKGPKPKPVGDIDVPEEVNYGSDGRVKPKK